MQRRKNSIRLRGYDYSRPGVYFVTICTRDRDCLFGNIVNGQMVMNDYGKMVDETLKWLARRYAYVSLDAWVVMPNHLHGIVIITDEQCNSRGGSRTAPTRTAPTRTRKPLGRLIGAFKTVSTKRINELRRTTGARLWQRNYYEHIIRNENELNAIRRYILNNPLNWDLDRDNRAVFNTKNGVNWLRSGLTCGDNNKKQHVQS